MFKTIYGIKKNYRTEQETKNYCEPCDSFRDEIILDFNEIVLTIGITFLDFQKVQCLTISRLTPVCQE